MLLAILLALSTFASTAGSTDRPPQILNVDNKVTINIDAVSLGRFLELWDKATGMSSTAPKDLLDRSVTVHLSGMPVNQAVQKIFDELHLDYVFIDGKGIVVTAPSEERAVYEPPLLNQDVRREKPQPADPDPVPQDLAPQPLVPQPALPQAQAPPPPRPIPMIPTPFGPIPDVPRNLVQLPPVWNEAPPIPFWAPLRPFPIPAGPEQILSYPVPSFSNPYTLLPNSPAR